jgi:hypothetical protein
MIFRDDPLSRAVDEMNRFTARRLVIDDPRIAALPVSGVLLTDRPDDFVAAIAAFYPLKTERASPGLARLTWRQKPDDPGLFRTCPGCILEPPRSRRRGAGEGLHVRGRAAHCKWKSGTCKILPT